MTKLRAFIVLLAIVLYFGSFVRVVAREPNYEYIKQTTRVAMRDGVELATDVYLPFLDGAVVSGKFPTVLARTPYGKATPTQLGAYLTADMVKSGSAEGTSMAAYVGGYYAARGYAFVVQDIRGRFDSGGRWNMLVDDGQDGWDCAEWIARQVWSELSPRPVVCLRRLLLAYPPVGVLSPISYLLCLACKPNPLCITLAVSR